jgi:hypothetical protein
VLNRDPAGFTRTYTILFPIIHQIHLSPHHSSPNG